MSILNKKIIYYLDKICTLYKSLDNGMNVNQCEFNILFDKIIILCNTNINKSLLCLLSLPSLSLNKHRIEPTRSQAGGPAATTGRPSRHAPLLLLAYYYC